MKIGSLYIHFVGAFLVFCRMVIAKELLIMITPRTLRLLHFYNSLGILKFAVDFLIIVIAFCAAVFLFQMLWRTDYGKWYIATVILIPSMIGCLAHASTAHDADFE